MNRFKTGFSVQEQKCLSKILTAKSKKKFKFSKTQLGSLSQTALPNMSLLVQTVFKLPGITQSKYDRKDIELQISNHYASICFK